MKATALDAVELGFETIVFANATAAVNVQPDDGELAINEMSAAGVLVLGASSDS